MLATILPQFDSIAAAVWFYLTLAFGLIWLRRHGDLNRGRAEPVLSPDQPGPPTEQLPPLTVLIAGKDEEPNIERCVTGLMAQEYPKLQIVVVNDRSGDRTGEIIDRIAARDPRVQALHVRNLPAGWFGKNHAMHTGVQQARGDWLCFSDADCSYDSPALLKAAMRLALEQRVDFLSVLPRLEAGTFWERVVQPVAGAIMVFWFPPQKVNDARYPHAYANGAFMLLSRKAYDKLGGHEPVRATLNEDMHLARRAKASGVALRVIRGGDMYRVRMYTGFRQICRGWSRIFYGCLNTLPRLVGSVAMLSLFSVSPWITLMFGAATVSPHWLVAGFVAVAAQQSVMWRFYQITQTKPVWALTYPLGAVICIGATLSAMLRVLGMSTTWRGTSYHGGATQAAT